jgi:hypothetical protein
VSNPIYSAVSSGSDEDNDVYLKFFADEDYRQRWAEQFPDHPIPPHVDPPYDRDRLLPECVYGPPPEDPDFYRDLYGPPDDEDANS